MPQARSHCEILYIGVQEALHGEKLSAPTLFRLRAVPSILYSHSIKCEVKKRATGKQMAVIKVC